MRYALVALSLLAGCGSVEPARAARRRDPIDYAALPDVPTVARPAPTVQQAENAVLYCREAWIAHLWANTDAGPAGRRLAKAASDLDAVRSGATNVTLEGPGGFPLVLGFAWVSGYHRSDGAYVCGVPPGGFGLFDSVAVARMDEALDVVLPE